MAPPTAADPSFLDLGPLGDWELGEARVEPSGLPASRKHRELGLQEASRRLRTIADPWRTRSQGRTHPGEPLGSPHTLADPSSTRPPRALQTGIRGTTLPRESHGRKPNSRPPGKLMGIAWQRGPISRPGTPQLKGGTLKLDLHNTDERDPSRSA